VKVTWNWLNELIELGMSVADVVERLTMAGLEVESVEAIGVELASVRCAEVVRVDPHPKADRLRVCDVRVGSDEIVKVVCGAPNVAAGRRVAYASPGTVLPGGMRIETTEIRGVSSGGMLCSEAELGLGPDASGILILSDDAPLGESVGRILGAEDTVLEISITPNRGDCLAVLGLAREIAALTGRRLLRQRVSAPDTDGSTAELVAISIEDAHLCRRYAGRIIDKVQIGPSPAWMQSRLRAVGMRPINNIVDITNYVMMERGQPLHAFDYERLPAPEITVRRAGEIATIKTLDGQERKLDANDLLITSGGQAVAIAGVMGGTDSEVVDTTTRILLESAWFDPGSVRRTSKRLGLRSEASYRFERTTDVDGVVLAAERAAELMARLAKGVVRRGCVDVYAAPLHAAPISLRIKRIEDLLGLAVDRKQAIARLKAFGMTVTPAPGGTLTVVPPSYRADVSREVDLIEEIVRSIGYDNVASTMPHCALGGTGLTESAQRERDIKRFLAALGLTEVVQASFCSPDDNALFSGMATVHAPVTLLNPMTYTESQMRLSLCPGLLRALRENESQHNGPFAAFSVAKVFWNQDGFREAKRLAAAVCPSLPLRGVGQRGRIAEFEDVKGLLESILEFWRVGPIRCLPATDLPAFHPGKSARIKLGAAKIGLLGLLHPNVAERQGVDANCWLFELDLEKVLEYCPGRAGFQELPRFPVVVRDVAILTETGFESDRVVDFVRRWEARGLIESIELFDSYVGDAIPAGTKSLAYSIAYRALDRTLTDEEVNEVHSQLVTALRDGLGVTLR